QQGVQVGGQVGQILRNSIQVSLGLSESGGQVGRVVLLDLVDLDALIQVVDKTDVLVPLNGAVVVGIPQTGVDGDGVLHILIVVGEQDHAVAGTDVVAVNSIHIVLVVGLIPSDLVDGGVGHDVQVA